MGTFKLTEEGFNKLKKELEYLYKIGRKKNIEELRSTAEFGDLRENSEYDAAVHEQWRIESRIQKIEDYLEHAEIIKKNKSEKVGLGSTVTILNLDDNTREKITIVSDIEADILNNKISISSPLGQNLMNKMLDEIVDIEGPSGLFSVKIVKID